MLPALGSVAETTLPAVSTACLVGGGLLAGRHIVPVAFCESMRFLTEKMGYASAAEWADRSSDWSAYSKEMAPRDLAIAMALLSLSYGTEYAGGIIADYNKEDPSFLGQCKGYIEWLHNSLPSLGAPESTTYWEYFSDHAKHIIGAGIIGTGLYKYGHEINIKVLSIMASNYSWSLHKLKEMKPDWNTENLEFFERINQSIISNDFHTSFYMKLLNALEDDLDIIIISTDSPISSGLWATKKLLELGWNGNRELINFLF